MTESVSRPRRMFGHPAGLFVLSGTEVWERFSFSGMQALLVLYMTGVLLRPGHVEHVAGFAGFRAGVEWAYGPLGLQPLSSVIFGLYTGLVFLAPVFGGWIGDRWVGQHRMVLTGGVLMALGHLLMASERAFLAALVLLILGAGCLKGNISTQVGRLYAPDDRRCADGFQIFSASISLGVIAAPLLCGTIGEAYGFDYGFAVAGIGMMIGLAIYALGARHLPRDRGGSDISGAAKSNGTNRTAIGARQALTLALVFVLTSCFLASAGQLGNVYSLWVKVAVDRHVGGWLIPVTWFQIWTSLFVVPLAPVVIRFWQIQAARGCEPSLIGKMAIGLTLCATGLGLLGWLASRGIVAWPWLLPMHLLVSLAYLYVWPVGLALFSELAPEGDRAMFIGLFFIASFFASMAVGWLGGLYARLPADSFWLVHAAIPAVGAILAFAARPHQQPRAVP
jgi:POT family proton-dependent oligopeptide transporter